MPGNLTYEVFIADPIPQNVTDLVPNGDKREFSPLSITLISGDRDAVLVDPPMTIAQTAAVGDWVESTGKNLTYIFATHGHGDHWFGSAELAERFGAEVVATAGTIEQMHGNLAIREFFWDALFPGQIPATDVVATKVVDNTIDLEGHPLTVIEVGHTDTDETSVLHVPDLDLVVAGDVIYNGVHQFLREAQGDGINAWLRAIDTVESLHPRLIVAGHKNKALDDDAERTIRETRDYLTSAATLLTEQTTALDFFNAMLERYPARLNPGALWGGATALYT
ncbi:MBL fold metallo-hydrolase [Nocardioides sp. WG-D5]|uniref:MBL fold metallo-hydrolase n=1 Tax=Nocardioides luteus TaxID=1844 RepID=UPI0002028867|nr:MBL fold metallo-hydrolase [Nocardioides luteus]EGD44081.1 putative beta-lactamase [Nocardioidaceae bacterium Broad-1]MBG6095797.1 glyoxylase-like metal-dependent hydrolase (beta-lactamase superfamily II) [Nocardioides luteus]